MGIVFSRDNDGGDDLHDAGREYIAKVNEVLKIPGISTL
jgi:hypothetical protein